MTHLSKQGVVGLNHGTGRGQLQFYSTTMESISLQGLYRDQACFLVLNGPSTKAQDLSLLAKRGILTMAVNNGWVNFRPNLWLCVDMPWTFHSHGWYDPGIMKFVPIGHAENFIHEKVGERFIKTDVMVNDCPNVWYFPRKTGFNHLTFLTESSVCYGSGEASDDSLGDNHTRSCMLAALRILCAIGIKRIFLLGADFHMAEEGQYSFDQDKSEAGQRGNNNSYATLTKRFTHIPWSELGVVIANCTPDSKCSAFPLADFESIIDGLSWDSSDWDMSGWYDQQEQKERPLAHKRARELKKYVKLYDRGVKGGYGSTNHGARAVPLIIDRWQPQKVLDVGCGWNEFCNELRARDIVAYGVDFACPGADLIAPAHDIPVGGEDWDVVCAFDVLEHLLPDEIEDTLAHWKSLAPRFCVSISYTPSKITVDGENLHPCVQPEAWWVRRFKAVGCTSLNKCDGYLMGDW